MSSFDVKFEQLNVNGITLRAALAGEGPLIVLVHGFPESWYSWRHQIPKLAAAGYKVAAIDIRRYGGSDKPYAIEAYRMQNMVADVIGVIKALGYETAILFGHDWGAIIVNTTAFLHQRSLRRSGLSQSPTSPDPQCRSWIYGSSAFKTSFFTNCISKKKGSGKQNLKPI